VKQIFKESLMRYEVLKKEPVARFYYKGHHSHPVQRTILVIEETKDVIKGYELRAGSEVRPFKKAPVRGYRKDKIALVKQCGKRLRHRMPKNTHVSTTLERKELLDLIDKGA